MSKKILLADDSITIQKVIELTFSDQDFDVVTVGNGRLALEKLAEVRPDIVLCDIIMPEKDGYEVCEQIKSSSAFSHVPVLLLTGAFEPFDQERASQVGSDGFLAKPFEPDTLIAKVKDLLSRAGVASDSAVSPAPAPPSPVVEMAPPQPAPREQAAPSDSLIPDEPFAPIEAVDFEEAPSAPAAQPSLAAVTAEESATLAGEGPANESHADTSSTVMFRTGDLPWTGQDSPEPPAAPEPTVPQVPPVSFAPLEAATETAEPEPVLTPESTGGPDLADAAGAAFEEVLEEDSEFAGGQRESSSPAVQTGGLNSAASGSALADAPATQTQAPTVPTGFGAPDESPTLKVAVPAMPEDRGTGGQPPSAPVESFEPMAPEPLAPEPMAPEPMAPEPPPVLAPEPPPFVEAEPVETFEPAAPPAPEPPSFSAPEAPAAVEAEPVEAFEPLTPGSPTVFAPEPAVAPASEPVEAFEPLTPEAPPVFAPEPKPAPAAEPEVSFEPAMPSVAAPEPIESFEPVPSAAPEPIESFEPVPSAAPEPIETFEPAPAAVPEPIESFEPVPPAVPEPVAFEPAPSPEPEREPVETFEPVAPEPPAFFEPDPEPPGSFEPARSPARGASVVETLPPTGPADGEPTPPPALDPQPQPQPQPGPMVEPEAEMTAVGEPGPASGGPGVTTRPGAARSDVVESFADLEPGDEPDPVAPSSEAASVPVPVDMVEKIAQRVVAQVSEKAVREIAWEVIPDLAEALIKKEIERLKAEIQKL